MRSYNRITRDLQRTASKLRKLNERNRSRADKHLSFANRILAAAYAAYDRIHSKALEKRREAYAAEKTAERIESLFAFDKGGDEAK